MTHSCNPLLCGGMTADLILLQVSAYIGVVIKTTATVLVVTITNQPILINLLYLSDRK